jgi:Complex I intermediate-associated protein 30 (CIA30)
MSQKSFVPWNLGRFICTLVFFETVPFLGSFSWIRQAITGESTQLIPQNYQKDNSMSLGLESSERCIFDFSQPSEQVKNLWGALDDVVMGGVSESQLRLVSGAALFTGNVSIANSGGFASVRTRNFHPPLNLSSYAGIALRVRGDGKRYKFFIRTDDRWDGVGYAYSFDTTPNTWLSVKIPFSQLTPVSRAKTAPDAPAIAPSHIYSFQLMLSKFEYDGALNPQFSPGSFTLEIESICAYTEIAL